MYEKDALEATEAKAGKYGIFRPAYKDHKYHAGDGVQLMDCLDKYGCSSPIRCKDELHGCPWRPNNALNDLKLTPTLPHNDHAGDGVQLTDTDTLERVNPVRDVLQEFPFAMCAVASITAYGASKHRVRSWRDPKYTTGDDKSLKAKLAYFTGKMGRHMIRGEIEGDINPEDDNNLHSAAVAWNALAYLDTVLRAESKRTGITDPDKLIKAIKASGIKGEDSDD